MDTLQIHPKLVATTNENGIADEFTKVSVNFYQYRDTGGFAQESQEVALSPADPATFTPASQVTLEQLTAWVTSAVGQEELAAIKARLSAKIDEMIANNPPYYHDVDVDNPVPVNHQEIVTAWQSGNATS